MEKIFLRAKVHPQGLLVQDLQIAQALAQNHQVAKVHQFVFININREWHVLVPMFMENINGLASAIIKL